MHGLSQDLRFALRILRKSPAFAAVAVATLAIGIGATTIMFAVVNAVLIQPLAYPHSEQLVHLSEAFDRRPGMSIAYANFLDWQSRNRVFTSMGAIKPLSLTLSGAGTAEQLDGRQVSNSFLRTLGVQPQIGRDFRAEDDQPSAVPTVILSNKLWRERFGSSDSILGRAITLDREQYTVIGVLPRNYSYNDEVPDVIIPIGLTKDPNFWQDRFDHEGTYAVARLKPGVTLEDARRDMDRVSQLLQREYPNTNAKNSASVVTMREWMVGDVKTPLLILLSAVGLLLLIACGNMANLLLAKGSARHRELAIRRAVGASRFRLLRQLLTESLVLSLAGGVCGLLLAVWGTGALMSAAPDALPRVAEVRIDANVFGFIFAISLLTGILFGIAPALHVPGDTAIGVKEADRGTSGMGRRRVASALIVGQIALSLALLLGAGLLIRSFQRVMQVDVGFNPRQLLTGSIVLSRSRYETPAQSESFYNELLTRMSAVPGVTGAATVVPMPMSGNEWDTDYAIEGAKTESFPNTEIGFFDANYVRVMQVPLVAGRAFTQADTRDSMPVAIVNQEFARKNFPGQNAIGKRIRLGDPKQLTSPETPTSRWQTVVGVIGDVKQYGLDRKIVPTVYTPLSQAAFPQRRDVVIRTTVDPLSVAGEVRSVLSSVDRDQAIADMATMEHRIKSRLATRQLSMVLLGFFAALALTLGAIGIYGVVSYWVVQRTREIGIRMALGAGGREVLRLILGRSSVLLAWGLGAGLVASFVLRKLMQNMLFGVGPNDLRVLTVVVLVLAGVTTIASYIPARRATKVDPMIALRQD